MMVRSLWWDKERKAFTYNEPVIHTLSRWQQDWSGAKSIDETFPPRSRSLIYAQAARGVRSTGLAK